MNAFGVASNRCVNTGENKPNPSASSPTSSPAAYWRDLSPDAEMIAFTGPVRHVDTVPTSADAIAPTPHATAIAFTGGSWPAARTTAIPCPFCTTSTVIASGTTSSTMARHENAGR